MSLKSSKSDSGFIHESRLSGESHFSNSNITLIVASCYSKLICLKLEPPSIYLHEHVVGDEDDQDEDVDKLSMHSSMFEDGTTAKPE